jgi:hypothetical protein
LEKHVERSRRGATTAQVKGDIQAGLTGDKVAGSDPGASPLGTDDEAGGSTFDPQWIQRTREEERAGRLKSTSANAATPELQPDARLGRQRRLGIAAAAGALLAFVLAAALVAVI